MASNEDDSGGASRRLTTPPTEPTSPEEPPRHIMLALDGVDDMLGDYPFYALVLPGMSAEPLQTFLRSKWTELNSLTGSSLLLLTPVIPDEVSEAYLDWLRRQRLPPEVLDTLRAKLRSGHLSEAERQASENIYEQAEKSGIAAAELPAVVITAERRAMATGELLVRLDRNWSLQSIAKFFEVLADACAANSRELDPAMRLYMLHDTLEEELPRYGLQLPGASGTTRQVILRLLKGIWQVFSAVVPVIVRAILLAH